MATWFSNYIFEYRGNSIRKVFFQPIIRKKWTEQRVSFCVVQVTFRLLVLASYNTAYCIYEIKRDWQTLNPNDNLNHSLKFKQIIQDPTDPSLSPNTYMTPNSLVKVKNSSQENINQWVVNSQATRLLIKRPTVTWQCVSGMNSHELTRVQWRSQPIGP